jgi:hypothetical protein
MTDPTGFGNLWARASARKPGDFPIGSLESRAAARALLGRCNITTVVAMTGLPSSFRGQKPIIAPPDTLTHYLALDESIVEVICREYEPGKFTACIHQTWSDGREYHGSHLIANLGDVQRVCRPQRQRKQRAS